MSIKNVKFIKSPVKGKKYRAILKDGKKVDFGALGYEHYKDNVIGLYSHLNHLDKKRRSNYRKRHSKILLKDGTPAYKKKYTPAWFSYYFLW